MSSVLAHSVFLHIPKTGGLWVTSALRNCGLVRRDLSRHRRKAPKPLRNRHVIATVRNPVEWFRSRWASPDHQKRMRMGQPYAGLLASVGQVGLAFPDWVGRLLDQDAWLTRLYAKFLGEDLAGADHLCHTENLAYEVADALEDCGEEFDRPLFLATPRKNESDPVAKFQATYTPELLERVFQSERAIFDKFGYSVRVEDYERLVGH